VQRKLLARAAITTGESVIDVGCGPGRLTLEAQRAAGPAAGVLGIDPSPEMIALARRKADREQSTTRFEEAPVQAIPAADGSFDVALASLMLHHVPAELQGRAFSEVLRVLKPGGRFVVLDFAASGTHGLGHFFAVLGLNRRFTHAEHLRDLAKSAGFERVDMAREGAALCLLWGRKRLVPG
jgi:ubiquinone/menaquinone biosynthesis C-methylase UbiE